MVSVQSKDEDRGIWGGRLLLQFQFSSHGGKEGNGTRSCHSRASIQFQSRELKRIQRKGKEKEERLEERQQGRAASGQWAAAGDPCPSGRWTWALFSSQKNLQNFSDSPSHRIFRGMHEVLNINENKN